MEYMKIHMQSAAAGHPSMSAAPQGDEALATGIDLITAAAAAAAVHDIPAERWKIMYKFAISLLDHNKKYFWENRREMIRFCAACQRRR